MRPIGRLDYWAKESVPDVEAVLDGYLECALFTGFARDGERYLDEVECEVHPGTVMAMRRDCASFLCDVVAAGIALAPGRLRDVGYDFWLTRSAHGAGFRDGDWESGVGERLSALAEAFGPRELCEGAEGVLEQDVLE